MNPEYFSKLFFVLMTGTPTAITLIIAVVVIMFAFWISSRKIDVTEIVSIGGVQNEQIQNLQFLVTNLTSELTKARAEIAEIYKQNKQLQLHIIKLETVLAQNGIKLPGKLTKEIKGK